MERVVSHHRVRKDSATSREVDGALLLLQRRGLEHILMMVTLSLDAQIRQKRVHVAHPSREVCNADLTPRVLSPIQTGEVLFVGRLGGVRIPAKAATRSG